jgi:hypothetical protein
MKIALVYFEENLPDDRKHHNVGFSMLKGWQRFYQNSKSNSTPCLLLDKKTKIPDFWEYEYIIVDDDTPPNRKDVLNKVGWLKQQAYDLLGKCVVMDIDAILKKSIDELSEIESPIAMAPDEGTYRDWHWKNDWSNAKHKYNAGVVYMNSSDIGSRFRELWNEYIRYLHITYFDEIIFSSLMTEMNGLVLNVDYNTSWDGKDEDVKVLHFSGKRKKDLPAYLGVKVL